MQQQSPTPLAYFITFTCYGTWLHGEKNISVDKQNNTPGTEFIRMNHYRSASVKKRLIEQPYLLDHTRREIVLSTIKEVCTFRAWVLLAAHIRTNHIHLVVHSTESPENIMNTIKAYASRRLNELKIDKDRLKRWTRHGSTRYLWNQPEVEATIQYVVHEQGEPMAVFENKSLSCFAGAVITP
ncbi:MAG TPA: transposase [Gammaproteobacteria bacterium]|nr:transposase [Gammaproteobacteria bacterium]